MNPFYTSVVLDFNTETGQFEFTFSTDDGAPLVIPLEGIVESVYSVHSNQLTIYHRNGSQVTLYCLSDVQRDFDNAWLRSE